MPVLEADDIAADIRATYNSLSTPDDAPPEPVLQTAPEEAPDAGLKRAIGADDDRPRDEHGRFAPRAADVPQKSADAAPETQPIAKLPEKVQTDSQSAQSAAPPDPPQEIIPVPHGLTAPIKAKFSSLDPDVREEFARLNSLLEAPKRDWDTKAQSFKELNEALAPVQQRLALNGLNPAGYVRALVTADEALRGPDKLGALAQVAGMYGIDLSQLAKPPTDQPGQQAQPPPFGQLSPEVQARIDQLEQRLNGFSSQQEARELGEAQQQIAQMRADPKYLYFDNVSDHMSKLMAAGLADNLPDAYERATWADPQIRQLLQAQGQVRPPVVVQAAPFTPPPQTRPNGTQLNGAPVLGSEPQEEVSSPSESIVDTVRRSYRQLAGGV